MNNFLNKKGRDTLNRLSFMRRYNNEIHCHYENVAEHSFYVSLYSLFICDILKIKDELKFIILEKSMIHDIHEIKLSDIPHDIKYENEELLDFCLKFEDEFNNRYFKNLIEREQINSEYKELIDSIVSLSDIISVYQYSEIECSFGNKRKFKSILIDCENRMNKEFKIIREYVTDDLVDILIKTIKE